MTRWEYADASREDLGRAGEEGWEAYAVVRSDYDGPRGHSHGLLFFLKRPLPEDGALWPPAETVRHEPA